MSSDRFPRAYTTINLLLVLLALGFGTPNPALAQQLPPLQYNASTSEAIIAAYAVKWGVSDKEMQYVVSCESRDNPLALGDKGLARGLVQIRSDFHSEITNKEAFDPFFSLDFLGSYLSKGKGSQWTCDRMYKAINSS